MSERDLVKKEAKRRWKAARDSGDQEKTMSSIYQDIAHENGFKDWNTYSALLKREEEE